MNLALTHFATYHSLRLRSESEIGRAETRGDICLFGKRKDHEAESTVLISDLRSTRLVQQCPELQVAGRIARWLLQYWRSNVHGDMF